LFPNEKLPINTKSGAIAPIGDSMSTHIKYAYKRHNTWVYRRTYPQHLQPLLGSSLKQSLKTADAKTAKARVAELNQTYQSIVKEAEQHVFANTGKDPAIIPNACGATADPRPRIERPRYHNARFMGERLVKDLAAAYSRISRSVYVQGATRPSGLPQSSWYLIWAAQKLAPSPK
jgi:hypothetical protein